MRIQCDVCEKGEASVYCVADEAAMCNSCDHCVHHANKLASKHHRFSLIQPPPKQAPLCDICQERRAFLFCQQDQAILCRECDVPIHKANEHTEKHNRFLLTGVKLSATSALYSPSSSSSSSWPSQAEAAIATTTHTNVYDVVPNFNSNNRANNPAVSVNPTVSKTITKPTTSAFVDTATAAADNQKPINNNVQMMNGGNNSNSPPTSSIAEYLIEMLPGWDLGI